MYPVLVAGHPAGTFLAVCGGSSLLAGNHENTCGKQDDYNKQADKGFGMHGCQYFPDETQGTPKMLHIFRDNYPGRVPFP